MDKQQFQGPWAAFSTPRWGPAAPTVHTELPAWETYFFICPYDLLSYGM